MATIVAPVRRVRCDHPGCGRSYLRPEHLNRHRLTHESRMFQCYLCSKQFTRNDLLHAHLRRHEKREKQTPREPATRSIEAPQKTTSKRREVSLEDDKQGTFTRNSSGSTYDPLGRIWPSPIEASSGAEHPLNIGHSIQSMGSGILEAPQSIAHSHPILQNTTNWNSIPAQGFPVSLNSEFPWPFQDGGIFGLSSEIYPNLPPDEYLDPLRDEMGHLEEHASLASLDFESDTIQLDSTDRTLLEQEQSISPGDYQRLIEEFPGLANDFLGDRLSLFRLFHLGLDYTEICMPFFHQPTLKMATLPPLLILAICSLGARVSDDYHARETGQLIHSHVWRRIFMKAMESRQVDIWTLQTMVVLEHIGFYALSRSAHEKADVFHAMLVTLARRSSFLAQGFEGGGSSRQPLEKRWEEWAERETVIRVAYTIFVHDVDYAIHFMHPSLLSLGMIKLPLPCLPALWQAKSATEWERQMEQTRQTSRVSSLRTLRSSIELLLPAHCDHSRQRRRGALAVFSASAFILQILIHGLASAIFEHKFRGVNSGCSMGTKALRLKEFEDGLACWYSCFEHRNAVDHGSTEMGRSALIAYHFASILLKESLSDIQMAAGTAYSWGRIVTPQRAQEAFLPLVSTQPVGQEAYRHALRVIALCFNDDEQKKQEPKAPLHPLHLIYNAFIAVLVLWAYGLGLSRSHQHRQQQHRDPIWTVEGGKLKHLKGGESHDNSTARPNKNEPRELMKIVERGFARPEIDVQEIESIRSDVRRLMHMVRNKLDGSAWELSQEARRVLDALLDKNGFME
ncbi:fungal-specific transcription factor domain-containing protein [Xylogone sp. PMI_703]|nr:fungal-specific transcription factor domain-containing protein [Xylogone sp. PMI_703]